MNHNINAVVSAHDFCRNFPNQPSKLVARDNVYEHVNKIFNNVSTFILIEGPTLSGKSEFAAGFMRRHPNSSVGAFLLPGDAYFYSPEYARLVLAEQMHWLINQSAANYEAVDESLYTKLLHQLQKIAKRKPVTFILDGLASHTQPEYRMNQEILALLPHSQSDFRFLISGPPAFEEQLRKINNSLKVVPLIEIAKEETVEFFSDIPRLTHKDIADIRKFCSGSIGQMSKFKSILSNYNMSVEDILVDGVGGLDDLMEIEWRTLSTDTKMTRLLAFLCFANRQVLLSQLSAMAELTDENVDQLLSKCAFVDIDKTSKYCSIRSTAQRNFLQKKLIHLEPTIQENYLTDLLKDPEGTEAVRYLPAQLMKTGHYEDLIRRLDVKHFCKLLTSQRSLRALKANSDLGLLASKKLSDEESLIRFSISGSVISGLTFSVGSRSRIEALIRLGVIDDAVELAFSSPTNEERLQLLATTAKTLYDERLLIPIEIRAEIKRLGKLVSASDLGPLAIDIACDLIVIDLDAAVDLFNKANSLSMEGEKADANTTVEQKPRSALDSEISEGPIRKLELRMSQKHHQRFAEALGRIVDRTSSDQIIARMSQSLDASGELMFLSEWLARRKKEPDAWRIANLALDLMLKDLSRSPRIEDLRAIAVVLPYIEIPDETDKLIKRIEVLVETDLFLGASIESVRLQMLLQRAKYRYVPAEVEFSILDLFIKVEALEDVSMRVTCLSWMLYSLQQFEDAKQFEAKTSLLSQTITALLTGIETLLLSSAEHFIAVRSAIFALAKADVKLALDLANRLNTEERRDLAFSALAGELFKDQAFIKDPGALLQCIEKIVDENKRSVVILAGLYQISELIRKKIIFSCNFELVFVWKKLRVANYKFQGAISALQILMQTGATQPVTQELKDQLELIWPTIQVDWVRYNLGYSLVRDTAHLDKHFSQYWLKKVNTEEQTQHAPSERYAEVLRLIADLVVRSYSYLAADATAIDSSEFRKVTSIISAVPIPQDRIILWCDFGTRLFYFNKKELAKKICALHVEPMLTDSFENNEFLKELMIAEAAPFLYLIHQAAALFQVDKIQGKARRDAAIADICYALLKKKSASDVYKAPDNDEYDLDAGTAASLISLACKIGTDWIIFNLVKVIAATLVSKRNYARIRRTQVVDFLGSLTTLIKTNLPDILNISHNGFKIASLAQIYRARSICGSQVSGSEWKNLYDDARAIANIADRGVVTAFVAVAAKARMASIDADWLLAVKTDTNQIPTMVDKIDRFVWLAEIIESSDKSQALALARSGMELSKLLDREVDAYARQKKILDLVFNIDPDLVDKYIDLADKDPARQYNKKALEDRIKLKKLQREAAEGPGDINFSDQSGEDIAELCMRNLASFNANRIIPRPTEEFKELGLRAAALTISHAYSIWCWIIENAIKKANQGGKAEKAVENLFAASLNSGSLLLSLLGGPDSVLQSMRFSSEGLVKPGDRDAVIEMIVQWARENNGREILISDPFFGPADVDFLLSVANAAPESSLKVLTAKRHLKKQISNASFEDAFEDAWRTLCDVSPFDAQVAVIGFNVEGDHPIHDRWLVTEQSGLRLGTSANSIGHLRISEISPIETSVASSRFAIIDDFISRRTRVWEGNKISLTTFDIH
jgi:hypothetical protein